LAGGYVNMEILMKGNGLMDNTMDMGEKFTMKGNIIRASGKMIYPTEQANTLVRLAQ